MINYSRRIDQMEIRNRWLLGALLILLALSVVACGSETSPPEADTTEAAGFPKNADGYADISVQQLNAMLENQDLTLVNVHVPYEGEIPQTDLFIPYDEIAGYVEQLPDKDASIVLYCRSGSMSTTAAEELVALGYTNVSEVDGGFNAWKAAGYTLLDEDR
jgi:rhodanese-related sulfurtransferase